MEVGDETSQSGSKKLLVIFIFGVIILVVLLGVLLLFVFSGNGNDGNSNDKNTNKNNLVGGCGVLSEEELSAVFMGNDNKASESLNCMSNSIKNCKKSDLNFVGESNIVFSVVGSEQGGCKLRVEGVSGNYKNIECSMSNEQIKIFYDDSAERNRIWEFSLGLYYMFLDTLYSSDESSVEIPMIDEQGSVYPVSCSLK
jgi:hypothetical protein